MSLDSFREPGQITLAYSGILSQTSKPRPRPKKAQPGFFLPLDYGNAVRHEAQMITRRQYETVKVTLPNGNVRRMIADVTEYHDTRRGLMGDVDYGCCFMRSRMVPDDFAT